VEEADRMLSPLSPQVRVIQKALRQVHAHDGWCQVPKGGNMRRHGWKDQYCMLDSAGFSYYESQHTGADAVQSIAIKMLHSAKCVTKDELIHAKPCDLPSIFQIMFIAERVGGLGVLGSPTSNTMAPRHNRLPGPAGKSDDYEFRGHYYTKVAINKKEKPFCLVCRKAIGKGMLSSKKAYKCKHCGDWCHEDHITGDSDRVKPCPGSSGIVKLTFKARDEESKNLWIDQITKAVRNRTKGSADDATPSKASIAGTPSRILSPLGVGTGTGSLKFTTPRSSAKSRSPPDPKMLGFRGVALEDGSRPRSSSMPVTGTSRRSLKDLAGDLNSKGHACSGEDHSNC